MPKTRKDLYPRVHRHTLGKLFHSFLARQTPFVAHEQSFVLRSTGSMFSTSPNPRINSGRYSLRPIGFLKFRLAVAPVMPIVRRSSLWRGRPGTVRHAPGKPEHELPREPWLFALELAPQVAEPEPVPPEPNQVGFGQAGIGDGVIPFHRCLAPGHQRLRVLEMRS